jgi:cobalt-precorrin-5B (C1)-methyltransferase
MLAEAIKRKFKNIIIGGHPGKLAKLIRGDFNTHSSKSKPANDVLIKIFKRENLSTAVVNKLNDSSSVEGMVEIIKEHNFMQVFDRIADDVQSSAERYILSKANIGTILFDMRKSIIGISKGFKDWQRSL